MDPRLIAKFGKEEVVKSPCVKEKCDGCPKQFTPVPPVGDDKYCESFAWPETKWSGGKTCPMMFKAKIEKEKELNPLKASKRGIVQKAQTVAVATGSKGGTKKN